MPFTPLSQGQQQSNGEQGTTYVNPPDMINHLLLVWPIRYSPNVPTKYPRPDGRPSDAVYVDIVDLSMNDDYGRPGKVMRQARWTQGRLIRDTKGAIGNPNPMLVQMSKDGDAYQLIEQSQNPGSVQMAEWWMNANPQFVPGADAPQPAMMQPVAQPLPNQYPQGYPLQQQAAPPVSAPPQQTNTVMDRLRQQAANNPYVQGFPQTQSGPAQPPLPPPPPAPPMAGFPDEEPPF